MNNWTIILFFWGNKQDGISAELGFAVSEDAMIDEFSERAEKEILSFCSKEKNLIGNSAGFLSKLCRNYTLVQKVIVSLIFYLFYHFFLLRLLASLWFHIDNMRLFLFFIVVSRTAGICNAGVV